MEDILRRCECLLDGGCYRETVDLVSRYFAEEGRKSAGSPAGRHLAAELDLRRALALILLAKEEKGEDGTTPPQAAKLLDQAMEIFSARHSMFAADPYWEQMMAETGFETGHLMEALSAYRQLQEMEPGNGEWTAGESRCRERLSMPAESEPFRSRVRRMWDRFLESEGKLKESCSGRGSVPLPADVNSAIPDVETAMSRRGRRHLLVFSPRGRSEQALLCQEVLRHIPPELKENWHFLAEDQSASIQITPPGWGNMNTGNIACEVEVTSFNTLKLTLCSQSAVEKSPWDSSELLFIYGEESTRKALEYCVTGTVGSLFFQRFVSECRAAVSLPEGTPVLKALPAALVRSGLPVPFKLESFGSVYTKYEMTGDPEKLSWRTGVTRGWSSVPQLLESLSTGTCRTADILTRHGAAAGSICIPLAGLPVTGDLAEAVLGDLNRELTEHLSSDIWLYTGFGIGEKEEYLDFLAWDLPAFLSAVRICLKDSGITGVCFCSMFSGAVPVPMEKWPVWNPPEGEKLEVSPLQVARSIVPDPGRRQSVPLTSLPWPPPEPEQAPPSLYEDLEQELLDLDCGKFNAAVDRCLVQLKSGGYSAVVQTVAASGLEQEGVTGDTVFLLRMLESMACYRKAKDLIRQQGKVTLDSLPLLRRAAGRITDQYAKRSAVMSRIRSDCWDLLRAAYWPGQALSRKSGLPPETVKMLTRCGQRAALPVPKFSFRLLAGVIWQVFESREAQFRAMLDRNPDGSEEILSRLLDVFCIAFNSPDLRADKTGNGRYRICFRLGDLTAGGFAYAELVRRAPKSLSRYWTFQVGDAGYIKGMEVEGKLITPGDVAVSPDRVDDVFSFTMYALELLPRNMLWTLGSYTDNLFAAAVPLLKSALGELWCARYLYTVSAVHRCPAGSVTLADLPVRMSARFGPVPLSLDAFRSSFGLYVQKSRDTARGVWRSGEVASSTCCPRFLQQLYRNENSDVAWLSYAGAAAGTICLPRTGSGLIQDGDPYIAVLEKKLREQLSPDIWQYLGWGCSRDMIYLDFLAWDLAAFLDGAAKCLGPAERSRAVFHAWSGTSPGIPLREWRSWKFPEWKKGFPLT